MTDQSNHYTSESIEVLSGLDPVKRRPGMYTDTNNPNHLVQEVLDNSVDEALAGFCKKITIRLYPDNSIEIIDNGRGMPVDIHPEEGISGVELIMTRLHAGGKFSKNNYQYSGGLHGVGVSVVNALSEKLEVEVKRNSKRYHMTFSNGEVLSELTELGQVGAKNSGTSIKFWPNGYYFDTPNYALKKLKSLFEAKAVLCPGLEVTFENLQSNEKITWCYHDGLSDYLSKKTAEQELIPSIPLEGNFEEQTQAIHWALSWSEESTNELVTESYVNLIPTPQGGTHVNALRSGLLEAVKEFVTLRNLLPRHVKLTQDDVFYNLNFVLSAKIEEPQFSGQTKERLSSRQCSPFILAKVKDATSLWLNRHISEAEKIAELIIHRAQQRLKASKKVTRKKTIAGPQLPGKLTDCISNELAITELFLVEGDSAGGSAKQARDKEYQAVMPLRGKILNSWEVDSSEVLASQEIHDIAVAIGVDPASSDLSGLRYGKICILADADSDGLHIATLLCALFLKHFKPLVEKGHVFVAMPPLYRIDIGKEVEYALDETERDLIIKKAKESKKNKKISVVRFKGLGEMNPIQLKESTMSPDTRRLLQLQLSDEIESDLEIFDKLLSKKRIADRRQWLSEEGNLADI
ncbi:DNA topoisomerase IV subunit B [Thiotrichales bacterium 19S9-12]|nr:DNA topoisomerase IV subunit B [Thiotrichales bacterium 19S9-11]MCF6811041.1 DNA topoisomerase IV subunit B [Thiotrichales bacterium 19S9-12]